MTIFGLELVKLINRLSNYHNKIPVKWINLQSDSIEISHINASEIPHV